MKQIIFTIGRCQPPTRGHEKLFRAAKDLSQTTGADVRFYVTRSHDSKKNPLGVEQKLGFLREFFPKYQFHDTMNAFSACRELASEGYERAVLVVGEDRDGELIAGLKQYIDHPDVQKSLGLKEVESFVVPRAEGDYAATTARQLARDGNLKGFVQIVPHAPADLVVRLYQAVRQGLGVKDADV